MHPSFVTRWVPSLIPGTAHSCAPSINPNTVPGFVPRSDPSLDPNSFSSYIPSPTLITVPGSVSRLDSSYVIESVPSFDPIVVSRYAPNLVPISVTSLYPIFVVPSLAPSLFPSVVCLDPQREPTYVTSPNLGNEQFED